jgi:hypothetical protein
MSKTRRQLTRHVDPPVLRRRNDIGRSLDNNYAGNAGDRLASLAGVGPMMLKIMASATLSVIRRDLWPVAAVHWFLRRVGGAQRRRTEK